MHESKSNCVESCKYHAARNPGATRPWTLSEPGPEHELYLQSHTCPTTAPFHRCGLGTRTKLPMHRPGAVRTRLCFSRTTRDAMPTSDRVHVC